MKLADFVNKDSFSEYCTRMSVQPPPVEVVVAVSQDSTLDALAEAMQEPCLSKQQALSVLVCLDMYLRTMTPQAAQA